MKRSSVKKSIERRRRRNRFRKLKAAALTLGLATAWGGAADNATAGSLTSSATITISQGATFSATGGSLTLTTAGLVDGLIGGETTQLPVTLAPDATGYYYAGLVGNDLVLSFPGDGTQAIDVFWGAIFGGGTPQFVGEAALVDQLQQSSQQPPAPLRDGQPVPGGTPFSMFDEIYGGGLATPLGEQATLVVFNGIFNGQVNTGVFAGTITVSAIPEPATAALLAMATGAILVGVRRRE